MKKGNKENNKKENQKLNNQSKLKKIIWNSFKEKNKKDQ